MRRTIILTGLILLMILLVGCDKEDYDKEDYITRENYDCYTSDTEIVFFDDINGYLFVEDIGRYITSVKKGDRVYVDPRQRNYIICLERDDMMGYCVNKTYEFTVPDCKESNSLCYRFINGKLEEYGGMSCDPLYNYIR